MKPWIITFIILATLGIVVICLINTVMKKIRKIKTDVSHIANTIKSVCEAEDDIPTPKSVSGATDLYLKQIQRDFPDYHHSDTEAAIRVFILEYLKILYAQQQGFEKSNVDDLLLNMIQKQQSQTISNVIINRVSIYDYKKTDEYATIRLQVSVGYDLSSKRIETKYDVDYTFMIINDNLASHAMECKNCGATLHETNLLRCPYCDAKIIRDTIMSWKFSSIK